MALVYGRFGVAFPVPCRMVQQGKRSELPGNAGIFALKSRNLLIVRYQAYFSHKKAQGNVI
jgi:hypothetical protein